MIADVLSTPSGATHPIDNIAGMRVWKASLASSLVLSSGEVVKWLDQLGGDCLFDIASSRPSFNATGGPNNGPYISKPSGRTLGLSVPPFLTSPFTLYAVCRTPSETLASPLLTFGFNNGQTGPRYVSATSGYIYTGVDPFYSATYLTVPRSDWHIMRIVVKDNNSLKWSRNDEPPTLLEQDAAGGSAYAISQLAFFMDNIQVAEFRTIPYEVSAVDHQAIINKLTSDYSIVEPAVKLLLFGDSHMGGVQSGTPTPTAPFYQTIRDSDIPIVMAAGVGACAANNNGVPTDFFEVCDTYALAKYADWKLIIAYGTNDCQTASGAYGWTSWAVWKASYKANIQKFITAGWAASDICLITPPYCSNPAVIDNLETVRGLIAEIATELSTEFIDWTTLMDDLSLDAYTHTGTDGLHANDAMHALLTTPALTFLNG